MFILTYTQCWRVFIGEDYQRLAVSVLTWRRLMIPTLAQRFHELWQDNVAGRTEQWTLR